MRYTVPLRLSKRHHILKHHIHSSLVSLVVFVLGFIILLGFVGFSNLDLGRFVSGFFTSLARTSVAYVISLVLSVLFALIITSTKRLENILLPIFDVLQSFPSFALFPILVQALKDSPEAIIVFVLTITMIWPILFSIITGLKNRREDLEEAATLFGANGFKRLRHFTLPEIMPAIIGGSIIGWGEGWEFIIGAELLVHVNQGVGNYLGELGESQRGGLLALGIFLLMAFLFVINKFLWLPLLQKVTRYQTES